MVIESVKNMSMESDKHVPLLCFVAVIATILAIYFLIQLLNPTLIRTSPALVFATVGFIAIYLSYHATRVFKELKSLDE